MCVTDCWPTALIVIDQVIDLDALLMENKYLSERLHQMEKEKHQAMATVSKYKTMLERRRSARALAASTSSSNSDSLSRGHGGVTSTGALLVNRRRIVELLDGTAANSTSSQTLADLRGLSRTLLDTLNDKSLALSHQRKTNK